MLLTGYPLFPIPVSRIPCFSFLFLSNAQASHSSELSVKLKAYKHPVLAAETKQSGIKKSLTPRVGPAKYLSGILALCVEIMLIDPQLRNH